jgi:hypothetical protein
VSRNPQAILDEIGRLIDLQTKAIVYAVERGSTEAAWQEHDERQSTIDALFLELKHAQTGA